MRPSQSSKRVELTPGDHPRLSGARVLLLDEPEAGFDDEGTALVLRLLEASEATCIIATHDPDLASCMDEIWTLEAESVATGQNEADRGLRQVIAGPFLAGEASGIFVT
jgi:ABC-type transporter Mla maintaining outer membrane lipid asymmetry ATPase subunit MlaF